MIYINVIVINNPLCLCGKTEDVYHFFFFFFFVKIILELDTTCLTNYLCLIWSILILVYFYMVTIDNLPLLSNLSLFRYVYQYIF